MIDAFNLLLVGHFPLVKSSIPRNSCFVAVLCRMLLVFEKGGNNKGYVMHRLGALRLMNRSVIHVFSHGYIWLLIFVGFFVKTILDFGDVWFAERYPGIEYLYQLLQNMFGIWWILCIATVAFCRISRKNCSSYDLFISSIRRLGGAWWLVFWLTLLQWASIPLVQHEFCCTEGIDLALSLVVQFLTILQTVLNFFMIPEIIDGNYAILRLYVKAFDGLRRQFLGLLQFFILGILIWLTFFSVTLYTVYGLRCLTECWIICRWPIQLTESGILALASTVTMAIITVGQVIFYHDEKIHGH